MPNNELNIFVISLLSLFSFFTKSLVLNIRKKIEFTIWAVLTFFIYYQSKTSGFDYLLFVFCSFMGLRYFFDTNHKSDTFIQLILHQVLIFFATTTKNPIEFSIFLLIADIAFVFTNDKKNSAIPFRLILDLLLMIGVVDTYYTNPGAVVGKTDFLVSVLPVGLAISNIFVRFVKIEDQYLENKTISILNVVVTSLLSYKIFIKLLDDIPQELDLEVGVIIGFLGILLVLAQFTMALSLKEKLTEISVFKYLSRIPYLGIVVISLSPNVEIVDSFFPLLFCPLYFYQMFKWEDRKVDMTSSGQHLNLLTFCFFLATPLSPYFWSQISMFKGLWSIEHNNQLVFIAIMHFISEIYFLSRAYIFHDRLRSSINRLNFDLFTRLVIIGVISLTFIIKK